MSDTASNSALRRLWTDWSRRHRLFLSVLAHLLLFACSWVLAFALAYNFKNSPTLGRPFTWIRSLVVKTTPPDPDAFDWLTEFCLPLLLPVLCIKLVALVLTGAQRASWQYVSLRDVFRIARTAWWGFFGVFLLYYGLQNATIFGIHPFDEKFPDSVFLLDFAGTIALISAARLGVRLYHEEVRPVVEGGAPKLLILGAGDAGENAAREILRMPVERYRVVGFLDDDTSKHGAQIHGFDVLGPIRDVKRIAEEHAVDELLIAMPSAARAELRRVVELCQGTNLRFKTLPALADLIEGRASVKEMRDVDINDLLGRAPVTLDTDQIGEFIRNRTVMVTGAGGSIGSEMCRQIARFKPQRLVLVEQAEPSLFRIDLELRRSTPDLDVVPYIADIGDAGRLDWVFAQEHPSAVVHAAAHKHVPMMELNPGEAVKNNIHGTRTIADAAVKHGADKFVMISTDKAVNPTSVMGCSKRIAELYIQGLNDRFDTQFVTVRFGNVLGSSGSVIPIFREQIARGGPVTVTHPEMVRYFMTIPEASQLVLQAASMGHGGEVFVLDMGEQVKIVDLAREMITLSGFRPEVDIKIVFTGMRPGEKLYEELMIEGEDVARTPHPKIGIWQKKPVAWDELVTQINAIIGKADGLSRVEVRQRFKAIVPEFYLEPPNGDGSLPPTSQGKSATDAHAASA